MGRIISATAGALDTTNLNGTTLRAEAGPAAIRKDDLLALGSVPAQLYPVQNSDYAAVAAAGAAVVAQTTVSLYGSQFEQRNRGIVDPNTGDIFIADTYVSGPVGCKIWKYSSAGVLLSSVVLDSANTGNTNCVQTKFLTNGNILVFWYNVATPYTLFFAIVNKYLSIIVGKTAIAIASTNPQMCADCLALSGGGFAGVWSKAGVGDYFAIWGNSGNIVYNPTLISGAPTNNSGNFKGPRHKMVELSNGNIFVGINDTSQSDSLRYCIFTPTGTVAKAYTVLTGCGGSSNYHPEVNVLNDYVLIANGLSAYVLNNSGIIQGSVVALTAGTTTRVVNDGTYFYVFQSSSGLIVRRIPVTATTVVANTVINFVNITGDVFMERGNFVVFDTNGAHVISIDSSGFPSQLSVAPFPLSEQIIGNVGDFCAIGFQVGSFSISKIQSASIIGVSQTDIAADSAGEMVSISVGDGGYLTNGIQGSVGKNYDHTSMGMVGNKGTMYLDSTTLKGI